MSKDNTRLDASESVFFSRQLESIDATTYEAKFPELKARRFLPTISSVAEWAKVYMYRAMERFGSAKVIANMADDLPRADVSGSEVSQTIKYLGASFGYDIQEIKAAAAMGTDLDGLRARSCRYAIEEQIDELLALGDTSLGLTGLLKIASGTTSFTPSTKAAGGTSWGTLDAPNATGQEVAADLMAAPAAIVAASKEAFAGPFTIALPIAQYNYAAQTPHGTGNGMLTALQFAKANSPYIADIVPWHRCATAGSGSVTRMAVFPRDPMVLGALVPQEYTQLAPQQRNLAWVVNAMASCGGIVCRYPIAVAYGDSI